MRPMFSAKLDKLALAAVASLICLLLFATCLQADEAATAGRDLIGKWEKAIVQVKITSKERVSMEGEETTEEEQTNQVLGTVIDPSGLTVCSLSSVEPRQMYAQMMGKESGIKYESEITDVKLRLADNKELPAKVVLRDKDLDIAFIRPTEKPAKPLPALDLTKALRIPFTVSPAAKKGSHILEGRVKYFARSREEGWCVKNTAKFFVTFYTRPVSVQKKL